jgi:D-tyrosyl-tRNA(Tyr) deacylase
MRAVVQRVSRAAVAVGGVEVGSIGRGLVVLVGVAATDGEVQARWLADKAARLRIFADDEGRMNRSLEEVGGAVLVVSQFTLYGDARKGRRPSFVRAAGGPEAENVYESVVAAFEDLGIPSATGRFGAHMEITLTNDGPVTILLDSERTF